MKYILREQFGLMTHKKNIINYVFSLISILNPLLFLFKNNQLCTTVKEQFNPVYSDTELI